MPRFVGQRVSTVDIVFAVIHENEWIRIVTPG